MSNSFMRSSYFQTQVNNANVIKNCYPCGSNCTVTAGPCNCVIPSNLTLSTLTVNGLIDASGLQFNPVFMNPGQNPSTTLWSNAMDMNRLYYGNSSVGGGGGGGVTSVTGGTNISTSGTVSDPVINFNPGGAMNMNGAQMTNVSSMTISSINGLNTTLTLTSNSTIINSIGNIALNTSGNITATCANLNVTGILVPQQGIKDVSTSTGTANQFLTAGNGGGSLQWVNSPFLSRSTGQWYVAPNGSDITTNGSFLAPYSTITYAISQVEAVGGGIINIAAGTYTGNLTITNNIQLVGTPTFQINEESETPDPFVTINGDITYNPPTVGITTTLNNMKIIGRIIHTTNIAVALSINNCLISKNVSGKFITVNRGSLVITESVIKNTTFLGPIGGNYVINCPNGTPVTIFNTQIIGNAIGILYGTSTIKLSGCVFTNTQSNGVVIFAELGSINQTSTIKECVFNLNNADAFQYIVDTANSMILDSNEFNTTTSGSIINNGGVAVLTIILQRPNTCANGSTTLIDYSTPITVINSRNIGNIYASFSSTVSQQQLVGITPTANTPTALTYTTTDITSDGVSMLGSQITVAQTGTYRILTNIQFDTDTGGANYAVFWLRINGNNIPNTTSRITLANSASAILGVVEYMVNMTAGQYAEIVFASPDKNMTAIAYPATTVPPDSFNSPANPSVITTIQRIA